MALELDSDDLSRRRQGGKEAREAALDRAHGAVDEHQRLTVAVDLVVHVEPIESGRNGQFA